MAQSSQSVEPPRNPGRFKLPKVDLLVHFSTMDLQRNVDMALDDSKARFDDAAPGWRDYVEHERLSKVGLREAFFDYWLDAVKNLGFTSARHMPLIRGDRNAPLYRLVEFSRHPLANKVWDDVAKPATLDLFD
jgi:three-Cys-motif partner protein